MYEETLGRALYACAALADADEKYVSSLENGWGFCFSSSGSGLLGLDMCERVWRDCFVCKFSVCASHFALSNDRVLLLKERGLFGLGGGALVLFSARDFLLIDGGSSCARSELKREGPLSEAWQTSSASSRKSISVPIIGPLA